MSKNNYSEIARSLLPPPPYKNSSNQMTGEVVARSAMDGAFYFLARKDIEPQRKFEKNILNSARFELKVNQH